MGTIPERLTIDSLRECFSMTAAQAPSQDTAETLIDLLHEHRYGEPSLVDNHRVQ